MYRALVSFSGSISMSEGDVKKITDKELVKDLLQAKYIEEVKETSKDEVKETKTKVKNK